MRKQIKGSTFNGAITGLAMLGLVTSVAIRPKIYSTGALAVKDLAKEVYQIAKSTVNIPTLRSYNPGANYIRSDNNHVYLDLSGNIISENR